MSQYSECLSSNIFMLLCHLFQNYTESVEENDYVYLIIWFQSVW